MDLKKIEQIKKIALIALISDDELMNALVLKGGNALHVIYKVDSRASLDLDFFNRRTAWTRGASEI